MSRRPALDPVTLVSRWEGYCLPCDTEQRPLALTWTGRTGLLAWLAGHGWADGTLQLTCVCCGGVDPVGWEDEPEPVAEVVAEGVVLDLDAPAPAAVQAVREVPSPVQPSRAERRAAERTARRAPAPAPCGAADDDALDLVHLAG